MDTTCADYKVKISDHIQFTFEVHLAKGFAKISDQIRLKKTKFLESITTILFSEKKGLKQVVYFISPLFRCAC